MHEFASWHYEKLALKTVDALTKNNFSAAYFPNRQQALENILSLVPDVATIGIGGSWTLQELGLSTTLAEQGHTVFDHNRPGLSPEESMALRRKQLTCDVFLTGTNAVTLDGKIVNVDGAGNRVAAMIFGPRQVIIVIGANKIVPNIESAEERVRLLAAPINNKRLNRTNPCVQAGICLDCQSPTRICNVTTILHKRPLATPTHIVIIGEELGF